MCVCVCKRERERERERMKLRREAHGLSTKVKNSLLCSDDGSQFRTLGQVVLANKPDGTQYMFEGHDGNITCATLSPDGKYLATGQIGPNADVIVWSTSEKSLLYRFSEYDDDVSCVVFSHDSRLIATLCHGVVSRSSANTNSSNASVGESISKLIIWDAQTGMIVTSSVLRVRHSLLVNLHTMIMFARSHTHTHTRIFYARKRIRMSAPT